MCLSRRAFGKPEVKVSFKVRLGIFDRFEYFYHQVYVLEPLENELSAVYQLLVSDASLEESYDCLHVVGPVAVGQ